MKNLQIGSRITPRASRTIDTYLRDIAHLPLLTPEEEVSLARRIHDGDERALERMVQGNLRFVISVAKNYQNMGLELPDLISAGNMGLVTAAKRFDETRGFKFCSYAVWWIRQSILQALAKDGRTVALPSNQLGLLSKIGKASIQLEQELQRTPTASEVTERLEADEKHVSWLLLTAEKPLSLDAPLQCEDNIMRIDTLVDSSATATDDSLMQESLHTEIMNALAILPENERNILKMSFGIEHPHPYSMEEIAMHLKVSRERVRQIQGRALQRLQRSSSRDRLRAYL